jgi:isoleucyl-tRNA synthetase
MDRSRKVLVSQVTPCMDEYRFYHAIHQIHQYCVSDLSAFYLDMLKDRLYASRRDDASRRAAQAVLADTLFDLVRMLAPFVPFTADEAWTHMPKYLTGGLPSVQLAPWPQSDTGTAEMTFNIFKGDVRNEALKRLEEARQSGVVANPLESKVVVEADGEYFKILKELEPGLSELFIVSQASLVPLPAGAAPSFKSDKGALRIIVDKPDGAKCGRCWLVKPEVGGNPAHPALCGRCTEVVESLKGSRG